MRDVFDVYLGDHSPENLKRLVEILDHGEWTIIGEKVAIIILPSNLALLFLSVPDGTFFTDSSCPSSL